MKLLKVVHYDPIGSINSQATVDVSVALELVIVNDVPTTLADMYCIPKVPPTVWVVKNMRLSDRKLRLFTVTVPATRTAAPISTL